MRRITHISYILICFMLAFGIQHIKAYADFTYSDYTITYTVTSSTAVVADAGPDKNLVQPNAGMSGIIGTASSTAGSITSTSWSYVSCSPSCSKPGMVVSGANGTSSPLQATMANMDGAVVGTHFTYKFSATDSAGNTGSDTMDIVITAAPTPNLIALYSGPSTATPGTLTLTGTVSNSGGADATSSFTSYFEVCPTAATCGSNTWTSPGITLAAGTTTNPPLSVARAFNPSSTTTYQVRLCADGANTVAESFENDNCSGWNALQINVTPPPPPPPTTYTITASSGANGSVTPSGVSTVTAGDSRAYTIAPASGYQIASVTVDGSSAGTVGTYTFSNVSANHTISATFSAVPPPPPTSKCNDGLDNDSDGKTDYPADPGCTTISDDNETDPKPVFIEF